VATDHSDVENPEPSAQREAADVASPGPVTSEGKVARHRFVWLFVGLLTFFVLVAVTRQLRGLGWTDALTVFEVLVFAVVIGGIAVSISRTRAGKLVTLLLGLPAILFWLLHLGWPSTLVEFIRYLFSASFLTYAIYLMLVEVFVATRVTSNILCASLCAYLLLGVVWALGYSMISILDDGAFTRSLGGPAPVMLRMGSGNTIDALYFSFTTMTTLGYGDFVPTAPLARAMACLEAIVGQLYLAVLVARLVGLQIVHQLSSDDQKSK
jgi:hypothetical protein